MTTAASALIADIGATNARFALLEGMEPTVSETYAVADYASPIEAARHFLSGPAAGHTPKRALIAAAGPVEHGRVAMTNAAWIVDSDRKLRVTRRFQLRHAVDGGTLARATTQYVCLNLDSGRAVRMPSEFSAAYVTTLPPSDE